MEVTIEEILKILAAAGEVNSKLQPHEMNSEQRRNFIYNILQKATAAGDAKTVEQCVMCIEIIERWVPVKESMKVNEVIAKLR